MCVVFLAFIFKENLRMKYMNIKYGSTYICEQTFSNINPVKNKLRSLLNDDTSLQSKTTNYIPDLNKF